MRPISHRGQNDRKTSSAASLSLRAAVVADPRGCRPPLLPGKIGSFDIRRERARAPGYIVFLRGARGIDLAAISCSLLSRGGLFSVCGSAVIQRAGAPAADTWERELRGSMSVRG